MARHCGIRVLALSLVTNKAVLEAGPRGDDPDLKLANAEQLKDIIQKGKAGHEEVLEEGRLAALDFQVGFGVLCRRYPCLADLAQYLVGEIIADVFGQA